MPPLAALRPVDASALAGALDALVGTRAAGAIVVLDLDRLHLVAARSDALDRALVAVRDVLAGRAPWVRLADDIVVALLPGAPDAADAERLASDLVAAVCDPGVVRRPGLPWTAVCGVAWSSPARPDLLDAALASCWRARHGSAAAGTTPGVDAVPGSGDVTLLSTVPASRSARRPVPVPVPAASPPPPNPFDEFLLSISGRALGLDPAAFVAHLDDVLAQLLVVADADYAFVDIVGPDGRTVLNLAGASVPGHEGFVRSEPRELEPDDPWRRMLTELEPVAVDDQFASHDGAHPANHPLGCAARAFLTVPFVVAGAMAGALGVGCVARARRWSPADVHGVRLTTGLVAAVLERDRLQRDRSA